MYSFHFATLQVILYTFPAICWVYGAGFVFSAFVTLVFWGGPAVRLLEAVRLHSATVRPACLTPANEVRPPGAERSPHPTQHLTT